MATTGEQTAEADPTRRGFWPTVLLPIAAVFGAFAGAFIVFGVLAIAGVDEDASSAIAGFSASLLLVAGGLLLLQWLGADERREAVAVRHSWPGAVGNGIAIGIGIVIVAASILAASTAVDTPFERSLDDVESGVGERPWELVLAVVAFVVLAPIGEEILFRAFLFRGLATRLPFAGAATISAVIFAFFHFDIFEIGWPRALALIATGIALAWIYRWRGLPASITAHATVNVVAAIAIVAGA